MDVRSFCTFYRRSLYLSLLNGLCSPVTDRAAPSGWAGSGLSLLLCSPSVLSWLFGVFASVEAENPHATSLQCCAGMLTQMASDPWIVLARPDVSTGSGLPLVSRK